MEPEPGAPRFMYGRFGFLAASSALPVPLFLGQGPKREWQPRGVHILKLWTHGDHSLRVSEVFLVVLGPPHEFHRESPPRIPKEALVLIC